MPRCGGPPGAGAPAAPAHGVPTTATLRLPGWLAWLVLAGLCLVTLEALGPSAAVPGFGRPVDLRPWLVVALEVLACLAGLVGLARAWSRPPRVAHLLVLGAVAAFALVPLAPAGSADVASYAAYGRALDAGLDPYLVAPAAVLPAVEAPWRTTPSVYGPLATAEHALAAAGDHGSGLRTARVLALLNALAFLGAGLLLARLRPGDARAQLLWTANPLLWFHLVAAAHLDALLALALLAACAALRRARPAADLAAGLALGAGVALKPTAGLAAAGLAVVLVAPARLARLARIAPAALALAVPAYLLAGPHVLDQVGRASRFTSAAVPWRPVRSVLALGLGQRLAQDIVVVAAWMLTVLFSYRIARTLGRPSGPARPRCLPSPLAGAAAPILAFTFAAPYQLPWYDAPGLLLLAALATPPARRLALLLSAHLAVLTLAYLPGRTVTLPGALDVALATWRAGLAPVALGALWVAVIMATARGESPPSEHFQ